MISRVVIALALAAAACAPVLAEEAEPVPVIAGPYAPRNECAGEVGAAAFIAGLADAVRRRDAEAVADLADPAVKLDFGEGAGRTELRARLAGQGGVDLWRALDEILPLGCAVREGELVLPWFFAQDLPVDDPYDTLLVTGKRVPLRPRADAEARPVRLLSWALVEPEDGYDESAEFQPVRLAGSELSGFVEASRLRSPLDYRLVIARAGDGWRIVAFIAGD